MSFIYNMADTWNAGGTTFNSILMNVSNGAGGAPVGAAASRILNLQANAFSVFTVDVAGLTLLNNNSVAPVANGNASGFQLVAANAAVGGFAVDTFAQLGSLSFRRANTSALNPSSISNGNNLGRVGASGYGASGYVAGQQASILFVAGENFSDTNAGTYMRFQTTALGSISAANVLHITPAGLLSFNSITNTSPAFKQSGTDVQARLADDTLFTNMTVNALQVSGGGMTVASLPVASSYQGALAFITDGTVSATTAIGVTVTGGGANKLMVYSDGTQWKGL